MRKQFTSTPQERKMKFAEAGVMFVLVLALTIFVGVRVATRGDSEEITTEPVVVTEAATIVAGDEPVLEEPIVTAETEVIEEIPADSVAVVVEAREPRIVTYAQAEKAYFERRYDEAAEMFGIYTNEHPANAWGFYMLGLSEWKAGDDDSAEEAFLTALEIKPDHVKSRANLGRVLLDQDRQDEAKAQIELALAADPGNTSATRVLARIQHSQGLLAEAAASYLTLLRAKPDDAWSLNNLGLIRIQQGRYEEALPALAKATRIDPDQACFQNNLGVALERTGHFTAAGEAFAAALAADKDYEKAGLSLSRVAELTDAEGTMPVDLDLLAASFSAAKGVEVAAVDQEIEEEFEVEDEPAPARGDDDTPQD